MIASKKDFGWVVTVVSRDLVSAIGGEGGGFGLGEVFIGEVAFSVAHELGELLF